MMKAALVVNRVTSDINANLASIINTASECADAEIDLIVYPEAAITGLINDDNVVHDLALGQSIPGPYTDALTKVTKEKSIYLATGILEREGKKLYDSAILLTPSGEIALKYRRINAQWYGKKADPNIYCQGSGLKKVNTPLGSFVFLICGDLFENDLIAQVRKLKPDWLLVPFSRCFDNGTYDQSRWDKEEKSEYIARVKLAGTTTFMVNYLADKDLDGGSFGGAMVVSANGEIVDEFPLGKKGILNVDL